MIAAANNGSSDSLTAGARLNVKTNLLRYREETLSSLLVTLTLMVLTIKPCLPAIYMYRKLFIADWARRTTFNTKVVCSNPAHGPAAAKR